MKNAKLLLLTVVLLLTLTGCRTRTTVPVDPIPDENGETAEDQLGQAEQIEDAEDDPAQKRMSDQMRMPRPQRTRIPTERRMRRTQTLRSFPVRTRPSRSRGTAEKHRSMMPMEELPAQRMRPPAS